MSLVVSEDSSAQILPLTPTHICYDNEQMQQDYFSFPSEHRNYNQSTQWPLLRAIMILEGTIINYYRWH